MYTTVIHIIFERDISFLIILKLCELSGFQTKLVFKKSFKYLKNEKINLSKVILKRERLFYHNIYILFYLFLYSNSHFDSNKSKKSSNRKKNTPYFVYFKLAIDIVNGNRQ
jgi:hypothetical protein